MPLSGAQRWLASRAPSILAVLIIILICISLAWQSVAWQRLLNRPPVNTASASQETASNHTPTSLLPLFASPAAVSSTAAPSTNLRLTLMGSFVHADPARSSAIIALEGSKAKRYVVGAQLSDVVLLHAVYRNRVEIKRNGRLETLAFKSKAQSLAAASPNQPPPQDYNVEQLQAFEQEHGNQLRERMQALQEQMQASETAVDAPTEQPTEND